MSLLSENDRFIEVIKSNKRILYKIINSYCKDPEDRQDIEQEILINIWKALKTYDDRFKMSTWIYRIALNVAITHYRSDFKRKEKSIPLSDADLQIIDHREKTEEQDSNMALLHEFIKQLNEFNKAIIILYLDGNNYQDIAEILGISETNVGTKINRIKKILKEKFSSL